MKSLMKTFCIALVGAVLFCFVGIPLPWMLGPVVAISLYAWKMGRRIYWPIKLRNIMLILFGYSMGRPFTPDTGERILENLPLMVAATLITIAAGLAVGYVSYKKTGLSLATCLLGSVPGGLSQMVVLAEEMEDTDQMAVTIMQTVRMLSVVFTVPFLAMHVLHDGDQELIAAAQHLVGPQLQVVLLYGVVAVCGVGAAKLLRLPTPYLLGPLLSTAICVQASGLIAPQIPQSMLNFGQIIVGAYLGTSINLAKIHNYRRLLPCLLTGVVFVLFVSLVTGYCMVMLTEVSFVTAFLSTAPGGLAEMGITALIVGADLSTMTAYQLFRLLFIMLVVPYVLRAILARQSHVNGE